MGQSNEKSGGEAISLNHRKMKNVKFSKNGEIMTSQISIEEESQFYKWQQKLSKLKKFDQYYLLIPKSYQFSKKGVCGSSGILLVDYDNYPYLLHDQIFKRAHSANFFTQVQLWYLLNGLVSAANIFKQVGLKVGDIQAKNVFLNEEGQIKVCNLCSWPSQRTNYEKFIFEGQPTYISPEQLQMAKQGRVDIYKSANSTSLPPTGAFSDQYKSQSFSIGMTMLQSSLLLLSDNLYNSKQKSMNRKQLTRRLIMILQSGKRYSKKLRMTIAGLCEIAEEDRLNAVEVYEKLKVFDSQISNLKECSIDVPVPKCNDKYQLVMSKTKLQENIGSAEHKDYNSINDYNNVNSITGTNSNQLYNYSYNTKGSTPNVYSQNPGLHVYPVNQMPQPLSNSIPATQLQTGVGSYTYTPTYYPSHSKDHQISDSLFLLPNTSPTSSFYYSNNPNANIGTNSKMNTNTNVNVNGLNNLNTYTVLDKNKEASYNVLSTNLNPAITTKTQKFNPYPQPATITIQNGSKKPLLEMGAGNKYLYNIYSNQGTIKTPTFNNSINAAQMHPSGTYSGAYPGTSWGTGYPGAVGVRRQFGEMENRIERWQGYSFSNISSISREQSDNKTVEQVGMFTPSKGSLGGATYGNEGSMELLKRIEEQILKSKQKFAQQK